MRIYTRAGDLAFKTITFPDGQPHFKLETIDESGFNTVNIETALKSPNDLFTLMLACDVLRGAGYTEINLDIRYLLAARMDRAISSSEPFTLGLVSRLLNSCGFNKVRILDAHSEVATRLIRNSTNLLPFNVVEQVMVSCGFSFVVCPDKGAMQRTRELSGGRTTIFCHKVRDMATGKLSGFGVDLPSPIMKDFSCLIIDDICDGGGTFVGLAKELRAAGAKKVFLYVTHGIFSKGLPLEGIDRVFTTDSIISKEDDGNPHFYLSRHLDDVTIIPISMKELA